MSLSEDPEYFKDYQIIDVLYYYDGPKIYTFYTKSNDFYLAYYIDDDGVCEKWLFTPTSEEIVDRLIKNELMILEFFKLSSSYVVETKNYFPFKVSKKEFEDILEYIPKDGIFLS